MDDRFKLFISPTTTKLYDIPEDNAEKTDLSQMMPEVTERMKEELSDWKDGVMQELEMVIQ